MQAGWLAALLAVLACRGDRDATPAPVPAEAPSQPSADDEARRIHRDVDALAARYREVSTRRDRALSGEAEHVISQEYPKLRRERTKLALQVAGLRARIEGGQDLAGHGPGATHVIEQELSRARALIEQDKATLDLIESGLDY